MQNAEGELSEYYRGCSFPYKDFFFFYLVFQLKYQIYLKFCFQITTVQRFGVRKIFFVEKTKPFIRQECIKLIENNTKTIYITPKDFYFKLSKLF